MTTAHRTPGPCPCCMSATPSPDPDRPCCARCGHRWALPQEQAGAGHYESLAARNDPQAPWFKRKIAERTAALSALVTPRTRRILEIGCAEGELGRAVKALFPVTYDGIELSLDRNAAAARLDQVFSLPAPGIESPAYDLVVSFHVLEHIADLDTELQAWRRLLAVDGRLLLEVPHRAGHPLLADDHNPEHLHQFTPASLAMLLAGHGFTCDHLSLGHYESPLYPDSIRVLAHVQPGSGLQRTRLLQRFGQCIGGPFIAYGIGGDFDNYVRPVMQDLPVRALVDSSPEQWGRRICGLAVSAYDAERHGALPLLVCSMRYGTAIRQHLLGLGVAPGRIIGLEEIYEGEWSR
ncbi:class I SAM-dependent methyltransferase [Stenotrophomonas acidaminiphila]|uniref:class I SAM-dependent methyltransferase n=1 Tax=Stenotrophomonas acidaminiphila TaxID=128780 RepID=UPI0028AA37F4|nr:class I SAM-dependent methyltransferase [Stenotrophomonas acidaminiphila]